VSCQCVSSGGLGCSLIVLDIEGRIVTVHGDLRPLLCVYEYLARDDQRKAHVMSSRKGDGKRSTAADLLNIASAIHLDLELEYRILLTMNGAGKHKIRAEVFRVIEGVRIGIAAFEELWDAQTGDMTFPMYRCLVRAYWEARGMVFSPPKVPPRPISR
jgi:hypothetical protein